MLIFMLLEVFYKLVEFIYFLNSLNPAESYINKIDFPNWLKLCHPIPYENKNKQVNHMLIMSIQLSISTSLLESIMIESIIAVSPCVPTPNKLKPPIFHNFMINQPLPKIT